MQSVVWQLQVLLDTVDTEVTLAFKPPTAVQSASDAARGLPYITPQANQDPGVRYGSGAWGRPLAGGAGPETGTGRVEVGRGRQCLQALRQHLLRPCHAGWDHKRLWTGKFHFRTWPTRLLP